MTRALKMKKSAGALLVAAALAVLPAVASAQAQPSERLLTVNGEGMVRGVPDMAIVSLGVVSEAETAGAALSANNVSMKSVLDSLHASGIEARDLQTFGFSVEPTYSQPPADFDGSEMFEPKIVGYRVSNNVNLRIRDLSRVGTLLDAVVKLGANSISGPTFTVEDATPMQDEARREAVADALRKAKLYADAAGIGLGPIFRIEESFSQEPQPLGADVMMKMAAAPEEVPIEGGELAFRAHVSVSWRLGD